MAHRMSGITAAVLCTVLSTCFSAGPAHAGVGDAVDGVTGTAGNVVNDEVKDPVGEVTGTAATAVKETVQKATEVVSPPAQEGSPGAGAGGGETEATPAPAQPQQEAPQPVAPQPQEDQAPPASATTTTSPAPAERKEVPRGARSRARGSATEHTRGASLSALSMRRFRSIERRTLPVTAPLPTARSCESDSLVSRDLRSCARAATPAPQGTFLPGLGGVPLVLVPVGLLVLGLGLVLVALGRRRGTPAVPAT